jgi:hypothetical protein
MGLIDRFGAAYTVRRRNPGSYVDGDWVPSGTYTDYEMIASIQPINGRELEILPEGQRTKEAVRIYTKFGLQQAVEQQNVKGDLVSYRGRQYEVHKVEPWEIASWDDLVHFKAIALLVEDD